MAGKRPRSDIEDVDPMDRFADWFARAQATDPGLPNAMTLATVDAAGRPSARIVLMKSFDENGVVFFSNYTSRKGRQLAARPAAALTFWWPVPRLQVRMEGAVARVSAAESDAYFQSRPRGYRLGAWASRQSRVIAGRDALKAAYRHYETLYKGKPVPRPPYWGGYRLRPDRIEFWTHHQNRLHDRIEFRRRKSGTWRIVRLSP